MCRKRESPFTEPRSPAAVVLLVAAHLTYPTPRIGADAHVKEVHDATCSVAACAEIIGAKWTAILVHDLSEGPCRFSELERACRGISPRTLSERLRALEHDGIVERRS